MARVPPAQVPSAVSVVLVCNDEGAVQLQLSSLEEKAVLTLSLDEGDTASVCIGVEEVATPLAASRAQHDSNNGAAQQDPGTSAAEEAVIRLGRQAQAEAAAALQQRHARLKQDNLRLQSCVRQVGRQQHGLLNASVVDDQWVCALHALPYHMAWALEKDLDTSWGLGLCRRCLKPCQAPSNPSSAPPPTCPTVPGW